MPAIMRCMSWWAGLGTRFDIDRVDTSNVISTIGAPGRPYLYTDEHLLLSIMTHTMNLAAYLARLVHCCM
jgi:hypothetical protein